VAAAAEGVLVVVVGLVDLQSVVRAFVVSIYATHANVSCCCFHTRARLVKARVLPVLLLLQAPLLPAAHKRLCYSTTHPYSTNLMPLLRSGQGQGPGALPLLKEWQVLGVSFYLKLDGRGLFVSIVTKHI